MTTPRSNIAARSPWGAGGFSLVEVLIAMLILALMAVGLIPLMIGSIRSSKTNGTILAANAHASAQLSELRTGFGNDKDNSCDAVKDAAAALSGDGPADSGLTSTLSVASCPASLPGTVTVTATVARTAPPGKPLVTLTTAIAVTKR